LGFAYPQEITSGGFLLFYRSLQWQRQDYAEYLVTNISLDKYRSFPEKRHFFLGIAAMGTLRRMNQIRKIDTHPLVPMAIDLRAKKIPLLQLLVAIVQM